MVKFLFGTDVHSDDQEPFHVAILLRGDLHGYRADFVKGQISRTLTYYSLSIMPVTNNHHPSSILDNGDLSDFFGGAWDFTPNGTFSDLIDNASSANDQTAMPILEPSAVQERQLTSTTGGAAEVPQNSSSQSQQMPTNVSPNPVGSPRGGAPVAGGNSPSTKPKPPTLYESLQRSHMMPQLLLSPYGAYTEMMTPSSNGMDWSPPMVPTNMDMGAAVAAAGYTTSPSLLDPTQQFLLMQQQRLKRPRVSPFLGPGGLEPAFIPAGCAAGMNMFPLGGAIFGRRAAKMPLSPVSRVDKRPVPPEPHDKMPIVLPVTGAVGTAATTLTPASVSTPASTSRSAPVRLLPATGVPQESRPAPPPTVEENIEKNLLSFLRETRDLEWENVTVIELKRILRQYELNATGKKADLMQRIKKIRKCYRHLEESTLVEGEAENKPVRASGEDVSGISTLTTTATATTTVDSSPDTMGSDPGLQITSTTTNGAPSAPTEPSNSTRPNSENPGESLDSLFSAALDLPPGQDLLFS